MTRGRDTTYWSHSSSRNGRSFLTQETRQKDERKPETKHWSPRNARGGVMKKRPVFTKLALVLLAIFLAVALKPLWQKAWIYMSGAVIPNSSTTHGYTDHHNLLLSVGGERWVSSDRMKKATAYHALVIPPEVELREDGSISRSDGVSHTDTLKWLRLREQG